MRRHYTSGFFGLLVLLLFCGIPLARGQGFPAGGTAELSALREEVALLRQQLAEQRQQFESRLIQMEAQMAALSGGQVVSAEVPGTDVTAAAAGLEGTLAQLRAGQLAGRSAGASFENRLAGAVQSMNPDISVVIDMLYHQDNADGGIQEVLGGLPGFGHVHGDGHGHDHKHLEDGFNMRHLELHLSADVDPYFRAWAIAAVSEDGAEMEEAVIETTCLPYGLKLKGGKFFSDFGRINAQHSHEWDFVDRPLIYQLTLGDHGLNEKGLQLSWLAPTPFHLLFGVEALQGENELLFNHLEDEPLPEAEGPRLWVGWVKLAPNLPEPHGLQLGLFGAQGNHQEAHDGNEDGTEDHWLDGHGRFYGADLVYKYDAAREHGQGDFILQAEYMYREKDLRVEQHDLVPAFTGGDRIDRQDGYYLQAVYGILPRWRVGLRWEQIGLTSESEYPSGANETFGSSCRLAGMLDFAPSHFSRLRLQLARGTYDMGDTDEDIWQFYVQWMISLGSHGAHNF